MSHDLSWLGPALHRVESREPLRIGTEIPFDIGLDETVHCGGYILRGIGLVPMRDVYAPEDLTEFCRPSDTCWGARVIGILPARCTLAAGR